MQCNSSQSSAVTVKTVPCVPQIVDTLMNCDDGYLSVSWESSEGAISYIATAEGSNVQQCSANETMCDIPDLNCGETYTITVRAHDDSCDTAESPSVSMKTVSCIPQNLDVHLDCDTNDASVSWTHTKGAVSYSATTAGSDGHTVSCDTANRQCQITNLHCGQMYNLTLTALDGVCDTSQSSIIEFRTAPCAPQYIDTNLNCVSKSMTVTWERSDGALWYITTAEGQDGHQTLCNTTETSCEFLDLHCSQTYLITVKAMDGYCQSVNTSSFETESVPCPPQNVQADIDAVTAFVTWELSNLTVSYTATAEGSDGHTATCTTSETHCLIPDLHCSQIYSISVLAFGENCSSIQSSSSDIRTAPCAPGEIIVNLDCNSNRVVVLWERTNGAISYDVTAEGSNGHTHSHNTTESRYEMLDLHCGQTYNITVTTLSYSRNGISSTSVQTQTAPCIPENLKAELNCDSNAVSFSWDDTDGAKLYTVTAQDSQRVTALFNTSDTMAQIPHLQCGEYYTISVLATDNICKSPQSAVVNVHAVPCTPKHLEADVDCLNNSMLLSWAHSDTAISYMAFVNASDKDLLHFNTTNTSCYIQHLKCATKYNISVYAFDGFCTSMLNTSYEVGTVPCVPEDIQATLSPASNGVQDIEISWKSSHCAEDYEVGIEGQIEKDPFSLYTLQSYWTPRTFFQFPVPCSSTYNISVTARNAAGISSPSIPLAGITVPCSPNNLNASQENGTLFISWAGSIYATEYIVYAVSNSERSEICRTPALSCEAANVHKDMIEIVALNSAGESETSKINFLQARRKRDSPTEPFPTTVV
ncbi:fibronectin type III domain-containing protein 7-like [Cetorhinus maximus]